MNSDGSTASRLTEDRADDSDPDWSPDGSAIVFARFGSHTNDPRYDDISTDIYQIAADGSGLRRLTDDPYDNIMPRWSPDGQRIAYLSNSAGFFSIYLIDLGTGGVTRAARPYEDGNVLSYDWSPDGRSIAFAIDGYRAVELYTVELEQQNLRRLTQSDNVVNANPVWSPLGNAIAFSSSRDHLNADAFLPVPLNIYIYELDGGAVRRITEAVRRDIVQDWRP